MELDGLSETGVSKTPAVRKPMSMSGKILIGLTGICSNTCLIHLITFPTWYEGGIGIGFSIICYPFVAPAFRKYCLPYVPATTAQVENVLTALRQTTTTGKLLDIGSGDGRIVIGKLLYYLQTKRCSTKNSFSQPQLGRAFNPRVSSSIRG